MKYPNHIYDKKRLDIATQFMQKRFRKMFPSLDSETFSIVDADIAAWPEKYLKKDDNIEKFWDTVYAIKLHTAHKWWVNCLTAENVDWSLQEVSLDDVLIMWPRLGEPSLGSLLGEAPFTKKQIEKTLEDRDVRKSLEENSDYYASNTLPRDHYPVVGILDGGKIKLEDGNRRALRKILQGEETILVYVGVFTDNTTVPKNYWVSTGWLRQLVLIADRDVKENGDEGKDKYKDLLRNLFIESPVAMTTYETKVAEGFFAERNPLAKELL